MPLIRFENVGKIYKTGQVVYEALHDVNLEIEEGELVVILGPSGAGKSTLLKNVDLMRDLGVEIMDPLKALEMVGLAEWKDNFPSQLSGGQQQRVSIARAIAKMPRLLLCDEPTGALDTNTGREVLEILQDQSRVHKKTVVMVTHNSLFAEIADIMCFIALFIYVSFDADLMVVEGALDEYYKETNFADLIVSSEGFTSEDLIEVNSIPSVSKAALRSTINGRMRLKGDEKKIEYNFIQLICDGIEYRHGRIYNETQSTAFRFLCYNSED